MQPLPQKYTYTNMLAVNNDDREDDSDDGGGDDDDGSLLRSDQ